MILSKIVTQITAAMKVLRPPFPEVPPLLMLCDIKKRSGISALAISTAIIARLPEIGIPNGVNTDGSENIINKLVIVMVEEIVKEWKEQGIALNVIPPASINVSGTVMTALGPLPFTGSNTNPVNVRGGVG